MPRTSSSSSRSAPSRSSHAPARVAPLPPPVSSAPPSAPISVASSTSFGQAIKEGAGFAVGNRLVSAIFGPPQIAVAAAAAAPVVAAPAAKTDPCEEQRRAFMACRPDFDFGKTCSSEQGAFRECLEKMK